jgi:hypothetical protein
LYLLIKKSGEISNNLSNSARVIEMKIEDLFTETIKPEVRKRKLGKNYSTGR